MLVMYALGRFYKWLLRPSQNIKHDENTVKITPTRKYTSHTQYQARRVNLIPTYTARAAIVRTYDGSPFQEVAKARPRGR